MNDIYSRSLFVVIAVMCVACTAESDTASSVPLDALSSVDGGAEPLEDAAGAAPENTTTTPDTAGPDAGSSDDTPSLTPSPDAGAEKADLPPVDLTDTTGQEESGWPVNPDKGSIPDPGWDSVPAVGTVMPNFTATDQYGNQTELYDFAGQGVPVVIDVGTWFCEPCKALAAYLSDGDPSPFYEDNDEDGKADFLWWNESYEVVYDLVNNGELIWITVLYSLGDPVTAEDVHLWHEEWPNPLIPVLADTSLQLQEYLDVSAMPRIDVLNENMVFQVFETKGPSTGMKYISTLP